MPFSQITEHLCKIARSVVSRKRNPALEQASKDAAASLARATADHARQRAALGRDQVDLGRHQGLAKSLREIREENHFSGTITAAFRGDT